MSHNHNRYYLIKRFLTYFIVLLTAMLVFVAGFVILNNFSSSQARASGLSSSVIFDLINQNRRQENLKPLSENPDLSAAAYTKAKDMARNQYFAHYRPSDNKRGLTFIKDQNYSYLAAGENLAVYFDTENELVNGWMQSPTHRQNILKEGFLETGVGVVAGNYQGFDTYFVVQFFAVPQELESTPQEDTPQANPEDVPTDMQTEVLPKPQDIDETSTNNLTNDPGQELEPDPENEDDLTDEEIRLIVDELRDAFSEIE
jgi:uncharacterized protein YkwD